MGGYSGAGDRPKLGLRMAGQVFLVKNDAFLQQVRTSIDFMQGWEFLEEGLTIWWSDWYGCGKCLGFLWDWRRFWWTLNLVLRARNRIYCVYWGENNAVLFYHLENNVGWCISSISCLHDLVAFLQELFAAIFKFDLSFFPPETESSMLFH